MRLTVVAPAIFSAVLSMSTISGFGQSDVASAPARNAALIENFGKLPLSFELNVGQTDPSIRFLARGNGYSLLLTDSAAVLALTKDGAHGDRSLAARASHARGGDNTRTADIVQMELAGASRDLKVAGTDRMRGTANYFIGKDPSKWRSDVPTFSRVNYSGVYPGVDLVYYGNQRRLEYDFVVAPGADPRPIRLRFSGARRLKLDSDGSLRVIARGGSITFHEPVVYQIKDGERQPIDGRFWLLAKNTVGFSLGHYDHTRSLVIDPVLTYSTYLGGSNGGDFGDYSKGVAVDASGNVYVSGRADSTNFPVTGDVFQPQNNEGIYGANAFVAKIDPTGTELLYSTYLGGSSDDANDFASGIAVDGAGDAFVTGTASSNNFPVTLGAFQAVNHGGINGFVAELNPTGSGLVYSTYLGGNAHTCDGDFGNGIAVDSAGEAYVTGKASSANFPVTAGAFQTVNNDYCLGNPFVAKLNSTGTGLVYATYLGGSRVGDSGFAGAAIAIDGAGNAYVTGATHSPDFPVTSNAYQPTNLGQENVFVTKVNPTGTGLVYSTYLGGNFADSGAGIAVDASGDAYVTGAAYSKDFPVTPGGFQQQMDSSTDHLGPNAFVTELNPSGTALIYSTYLGGNGNGDYANAIAVDAAGEACVTGSVTSTDFPVTAGAVQAVNNSAGSRSNAFVTKLNSTGTGLLYSTYLGGSGVSNEGDIGYGIAVDNVGNVYVAGQAYSTDFPVTTGAIQTANNGASDEAANAFVAKLAIGSNTTSPTAAPTFSPGAGTYTSAQSVVISDTTSGAIIYYTTDGTLPTPMSTVYSTAVAVASSETLSAIAIAPGSSTSAEATATYSIVPAAGSPTVTALTASPNPSSVAESVTLTATVTAQSGGTPTGAVTFSYGTTILGTASLSGGSAVLNYSSLPVGTDSISATYSGDSSFAGSTSNAVGEVVNAETSAASEFILYNFTGNGGDGDGFSPTGGLVMDGRGNIYGTTYTGGSAPSGPGTVFKLSPSAPFWSETILHNFGNNGTDGFYPNGGMVLDSQGNLYGTTTSGGTPGQNAEVGVGTVFKVAPDGTESVIYSFNSTTGDGWRPYEGLIMDIQGNLYGTTFEGGTSQFDSSNPACFGSGCGTVFEVTPGGVETVLYNFTGPDGSSPGAGSGGMGGVRGLTMDAQGNLYGATYSGGAYNYGTVFKLTPPTNGGAWTETVLHSFNNDGTDGVEPDGGLVIDGQGNLYGTTYIGGNLAFTSTVGGGTVFKLTQEGVETVLFNFPVPTAGDTAWYPQPGLVLDNAGNVFGVTNGELGAEGGIVFEVAPSGVLTVPHNFPAGADDGFAPQGGLLSDSNRDLYGVANGGSAGGGIVYEITPPTASNTAAPTFNPPPGTYSSPQMVTISDGTAGSSIYYTTLAIASTQSTNYSGAIPVSSTTILSAIASAPGLANSAPVLAEYTIILPAAVTLSTTSVAFGNQEVGTSSASQAVTLTNSGGATLTFSAQITGANASSFSITSSTCGTSLTDGASCTFNLQFSPASLGSATAALTFTDNASGSPHSVALSGTAAPTPAAMTLPTQGSVLGTANVAFTWTAGAGVTEYQLWLGLSGPGSSSLYASGWLTTTSTSVAKLPANGATVYARLYSMVNGKTEYNDYTYSEAAAPSLPATMITPAQGSTLGTSNVAFTWTAGSGVTEYQLWLGLSGPGSSSLYASGWLTTMSATVASVPAKGAAVYARLYSMVNGKVEYNDYTYTEPPAPGSPATMITPAQGATLGTSDVAFTWTAGTGVTEYQLWLGLSAPGSSNLYASGWLTTMSATVASVPAKGATVYARLYSMVNGKVEYNDYTYTEPPAPGSPATMITPVQGSTLGTSNIAFTWTAGTEATEYQLWLGLGGPGSSNLYASGWLTTMSTTVASVPAKGVTVYARLYSLVNGKVEYNDYAYGESGQLPQTESILYTFTGNGNSTTDGWSPAGGMVMDGQGNLYGTTVNGGSGGYGTVFKVSPSGQETILYSFTDNLDGNSPNGGLIIDAQGNLYGTTRGGTCTVSGGGICYGGYTGVVFKVAGDGTETTLHNFQYGSGASGTDGLAPNDGLVMDSSGNLYGTTSGGGNATGCGTVFEVTPGGTETVLYSFSGPDGCNPGEEDVTGLSNSGPGLTMDANGNLYGTTYDGGASGQGVVFKLAPNGTETVLHSFANNGTDGTGPLGGLALDSQGDLYGATSSGGAFGPGGGTIFKIAPDGTESILFSFDSELPPQPGLTLDGNGNLYGASSGDEAIPGLVFQLAPSGILTFVHTFPGYLQIGDGSYPQGGLLLAANGSLYGATSSDAVYSSGTVFELSPSASTTAAPVFSVAPGRYSSTQTVTITDATPGATINYTVNGQIPLTNGTVYRGPLTISSSTVLGAIAVAPNGTASDPVEANYVIAP